MIYRFNVRQSMQCFADISAINRENKARYSSIIVCITFAQYCITLQFRYYGSSNSSFMFLFFSRCVKGVQKNGFDHRLFDVKTTDFAGTVLYFDPINMNGEKIINLAEPTESKGAATKGYVDIQNAKQDIAIADKATKGYVDGEIANLHVNTSPLLPRDGSRKMTGDLDMDRNHILYVDNLDDHKVDDEYGIIVKDVKSVVNKEYLNSNFLKKVDKDGAEYYDLKSVIIKNSGLYYDGLFSDAGDLVSKAFVDAEISKLPKPTTDVLKLDGSKSMTGDLNMGNNDIDNLKTIVEDDGPSPNYDQIKHKAVNFELLKSTRDYVIREIAITEADLLPKDGSEAVEGDLNMDGYSIKNLKDPRPSDASNAASVNFVNKTINDSNAIISTLIDTKIKESETHSIESTDKENVFKRVMDNDEFKEDDSDIHKIGVANKDFHSINKKTYEFKIDYDSSLGYYSTRLSIDLVYLPTGSYTMVYEMYVADGITIDELNASSGTLSVGKINSRIDGTKTRSIIHFSKYIINPSFDDLDVDIRLKGKTDPQTTIYVVVYGVAGTQNDVEPLVWDRFYYIENQKVHFEADIDMGKKQIKNLGDGNEDNDAINFKQLIDTKTSFQTSVSNLQVQYKQFIQIYKRN